uniref:Integrase n=1 Tax=Dulem virus 33 TaxID=3145751 RepID=A0AAU8B734_9CAUD
MVGSVELRLISCSHYRTFVLISQPFPGENFVRKVQSIGHQKIFPVAEKRSTAGEGQYSAGMLPSFLGGIRVKRANGTGTVVKLSGNRRRPYAVRVSGRDENNRIIQTTLSYHAKAQEAQAALDKYNQLKAAGTAPAADMLNMTVQQVFDAWKARTYRKLKPQSISSHNAAWNKRVSRYADRKFRSVSLDEWQILLDEAEDEGKSQSTINNIAILIKALYRYAMERDIVGKNYSDYLDVPSVDPIKAKDALTDIQVAQLERMAQDGVPWADTALILCYTGFRISEFLELTRFSYHPENGGYLQGGLKTRAGRARIVPIHPKIKPYILDWIAKGGETIICNDDGTKIRSDKYRDFFTGLMEKIDLPNATPHWCRHTFATRLHAAKVDLITTKWLLGHSTKSDITSHYTHETLSTLIDAIALLA